MQQLQAGLVRFKQMAKPQDRKYVRQAGNASIHPYKLAIQRHIAQGFFHSRSDRANH
jgi:hypothetical protein